MSHNSPLPYMQLQHDFAVVQQDIVDGTVAAEDCWLSCYKEGETSVHGKIRLMSGNEEKSVEYEPRDGVEVQVLSSDELMVSAPDLNVRQSLIRIPQRNYSVNSYAIDALDVSPDGTKFVAGSKNGWLRVGNVIDGVVSPNALRGHVGDVTFCKFFPSGEVILSASMDFSLRIFSATSGANPRVLKGHSRSVTSALIIERGVFVVSGSLDGSVRIWNVGKGECIKKFNVVAGVESTCVIPLSNDATVVQHEPSDFEATFENVAILVGLNNGSIAKIVPNRKDDSSVILNCNPRHSRSSINAIDFDERRRLAVTGSSDGSLSIYHHKDESQSNDDVMQTDENNGVTELFTWRRTEAPVNCVSILSDDNLVEIYIAGDDGLPYRLSIPLDHDLLTKQRASTSLDDFPPCPALRIMEFSGIDNEPATSLCVYKSNSGNQFVGIGAKDGMIRRFRG